jgi:hypothetical protein
MAEARNGADSNTPAVEMEAVSMNCRRVEWNKMASFRKPAASWLLLRLGSAAGCGNCGQCVKGLRNAFASLTKAASIFRDQSLIDKCLTV